MNAFEAAIKAANDQSVKEAAEGMYSIYRALMEAGFDKSEALTLMTSLMQNNTRKEQTDDR